MAPTGVLPAADKKEFKQLLNCVIKQWSLTRPVDLMTANRMVTVWMRMRYVEDCIHRYGMFFEDKDDKGTTTNIRMNQLSFFLKQLEADFRSYYRLLSQNNQIPEGTKESFADWFVESKE